MGPAACEQCNARQSGAPRLVIAPASALWWLELPAGQSGAGRRDDHGPLPCIPSRLPAHGATGTQDRHGVGLLCQLFRACRFGLSPCRSRDYVISGFHVPPGSWDAQVRGFGGARGGAGWESRGQGLQELCSSHPAGRDTGWSLRCVVGCKRACLAKPRISITVCSRELQPVFISWGRAGLVPLRTGSIMGRRSLGRRCIAAVLPLPCIQSLYPASATHCPLLPLSPPTRPRVVLLPPIRIISTLFPPRRPPPPLLPLPLCSRVTSILFPPRFPPDAGPAGARPRRDGVPEDQQLSVQLHKHRLRWAQAAGRTAPPPQSARLAPHHSPFPASASSFSFPALTVAHMHSHSTKAPAPACTHPPPAPPVRTHPPPPPACPTPFVPACSPPLHGRHAAHPGGLRDGPVRGARNHGGQEGCADIGASIMCSCRQARHCDGPVCGACGHGGMCQACVGMVYRVGTGPDTVDR